jgi:hypothetical protein
MQGVSFFCLNLPIDKKIVYHAKLCKAYLDLLDLPISKTSQTCKTLQCYIFHTLQHFLQNFGNFTTIKGFSRNYPTSK